MKEKLEIYKKVYEDANNQLEVDFELMGVELPPRYYMNKGVIEFIEVLESEMDENENKS